VGLILDLAVAALALLVIGSLALLAWTLGISAVRSVQRERLRVADARRTVAAADDRMRTSAAAASHMLTGLVARTTPPKPGDDPEA
jgi:hypothetical protein